MTDPDNHMVLRGSWWDTGRIADYSAKRTDDDAPPDVVAAADRWRDATRIFNAAVQEVNRLRHATYMAGVSVQAAEREMRAAEAEYTIIDQRWQG